MNISHKILRYRLESDGYTVLLGKEGIFIGRIRKSRRSYQHSNGRTYRSSSWAAYPVSGAASYEHRTREAAGAALKRIQSEEAEMVPRYCATKLESEAAE